ncbi:13099_t:CDS:1 [Acaulospora morrowiae]|uniref:13099_t:CDS:1 n=1 Tax=Acaulospora morrowiae TaxID=94023 RepID=A0A9N9BWL0_9GLOM|nr:13099_t:CDS:1 [Acaulospora morrowiae]
MSSSRVIRRQPRGSINKRACENCRRLKIRCDGDSERNVECSNCETGTCVFDKAPRRNRQVERLNNQVKNLETNLERIRNDFHQQASRSDHIISILKQEKEIQRLLLNCQSYFQSCHEHQIIFEQLNQIIEKSQCWSILLPLVRELLIRLSHNTTDSVSIINALKMIAENTMRFCQPDSSINGMTPPPELTSTIMSNTNLYNSNNASSSSEILQSPQVNDGLEINVAQSQFSCLPTISPFFPNLDIGDLSSLYLNDME